MFDDENFIITVFVSKDSSGWVINNSFDSVSFSCDGYNTETVSLSENGEKLKYNFHLGDITLSEEIIEDDRVSGKGTAESPFIITNAEHITLIGPAVSENGLIKGVQAKSAHYAMGNDIDLSENKEFNGIGTAENKFGGSFDGNGYTITLAIDVFMDGVIGLFRYLDNAEITNVTTASSYYIKGTVPPYCVTRGSKKFILK
jgi:hypothetical protein